MQWMGVLGWTPADFWSADLLELNVAIEGWRKANGAESKGMSDETHERLSALMDAHPDTLPSIRKTAKPLSAGEVGRLKTRVGKR